MTTSPIMQCKGPRAPAQRDAPCPGGGGERSARARARGGEQRGTAVAGQRQALTSQQGPAPSTMPRDNMASLIQRVAQQARITFRGPAPGPGFGENLHRLQQLLNEVRAEDLHLAPRGPAAVPGAGCSRAGAGAGAVPPVSYMHICETESFSMGVFLLRSGACIPLHDHPGMNGMLKVLYGSLRIACLDPLPPAAPPGARRRALLRSRQLYTPASPPCLLSPHTDNLHQIDAVDGPAAFLDILAPPYDPEHGRDCHYYRLLEAPAAADPHALPREVWLLETPQAPDFWCGGEPYPGPKVSP
ncbi:2-aminoethanethiol dioxygenase [Emydura macquarii macquarii]|uniref:2-aminoethanethiol dioxygenase n=1 Tax=Emydura macquarii macquarii TaxID=1129001 RepID=UPI00352B764C